MHGERQVIRPNYYSPRMFPHRRLNFTENMSTNGRADETTLMAGREGGTEIEQFTYGELPSRVDQLANGNG